MSKFSYTKKAQDLRNTGASSPPPASKADSPEGERAEDRPRTSAPREEPKKLTATEVLEKALEGHGHIFSEEEKKALGKEDDI